MSRIQNGTFQIPLNSILLSLEMSPEHLGWRLENVKRNVPTNVNILCDTMFTKGKYPILGHKTYEKRRFHPIYPMPNIILTLKNEKTNLFGA